MTQSQATATHASENSIPAAGTSSAPGLSTFAPGLALLPRGLRADVRSLYGALRTLDDLVDEDRPQASLRVEAVERWARGESAESPEVDVLRDLCARTSLAPDVFLELCQGMRHDIARSPIETEDDLALYCRRVGGAVGIMLAQLFGTSHPDGEVKMAILGTAMQLTNILRDIDEDAGHGRVYIARSTIERFGPPVPGGRAQLLRDQIATADALYEAGLSAIGQLVQGRQSMALSAALYREILRQIEREGFGRRAGCVAVPAWRRHLIIARQRLGAG